MASKSLDTVPPPILVTTRRAWKDAHPTPTETVLRKRKRVDSRSLFAHKRASSSTSSRLSSHERTASSPEPIYRSSRSRSVSTFSPPEKTRQWWTDDDVTSTSEVVTSEHVVKHAMRTYKAYFKNLQDETDKRFEPHETDYPVADLEYPNRGGCERFILLAPKDKDHYNPIMCIQQSLYTIVDCYLTPAQQSLFGTLNTDLSSDASPPSSPPNSQTSSASSALSSLPSNYTDQPKVNHLRNIQRAIHRRDGMLFLETMDKVNKLLHILKYPPLPSDPFAPQPNNAFKEAIKAWPTTGIPDKVLSRIIEETYQRCVGPHVSTLHRYEAFSSEVYGELMPSFTSDIVAATGLGPDSLFVDLGAGVGNVILQASLQTGCRAFGVEIMPAPAKVAREQLKQFHIRCNMWGVTMGDVELEEADMLTSCRVTELLPKADVVLVNNKVFLESLNEALRPKFLDLKEGAIVVSLKPFVSTLNARVTERNVDDMSAIFEVKQREYHSGSVSWGSSGGIYYLHYVDREGYASTRERFENSRARRSRSRR